MTAAGAPSRADRQLLHSMLTDLAGRQVGAQTAVRVWRNFTVVLCAALFVLLPLFALLAPHLGGSLVTIRHVDVPSPAQVTSDGATAAVLSTGDLAAIELWGGLGGMVGVIAALGRLRLSNRTSALQVSQLVLKPLAGAAVAIFGVVLIQGGLFAQLQQVSSGSIAAYATLFGFAQEALTRFVDRRAGALLEAAAPPGQATAVI